MGSDGIARFIADEAGTVSEGEFVVAGVRSSTDGQYLSFQRSLPVGSEEDEGVHVELNDQINSGYDKVARCVISRTLLRVDLNALIGPAGTCRGIEVQLQLESDTWATFVANLRRVFAGREELLSIT